MADKEIQRMRDELGDSKKGITRFYYTELEGHYSALMFSRPRPELERGSVDIYTINEYGSGAKGEKLRNSANHVFDSPMDALAFANDLRRMALLWAEKQAAYEAAAETWERIEREGRS
jgi:hypothetical protein